jgi:hypothetical protein
MMRNTYLLLIGILGIVCLNSCSKEYSLETGLLQLDAVGSLKDSTGTCLPSQVVGTFYNGVTPGSDTAYVEIQVDVDSIGNYSISTDLQNGFMFADSGYFSSTGINTIRLKPIGTPILQKPTDFIVIFDTSICGFTINVQDSTGTGLGGGGGTIDSTNLSDTAWKFTVGGNTYNGPIDTADVRIDTTTSLTYLYLFGTSAATADSVFVAAIILPTGQITTGTYLSSLGSGFYFTDAAGIANGTFIFQADPFTTGFSVSITISSYDTVTNIVTGTFSGTAVDGLGGTANISGGSFKAKVGT